MKTFNILILFLSFQALAVDLTLDEKRISWTQHFEKSKYESAFSEALSCSLNPTKNCKGFCSFVAEKKLPLEYVKSIRIDQQPVAEFFNTLSEKHKREFQNKVSDYEASLELISKMVRTSPDKCNQTMDKLTPIEHARLYSIIAHPLGNDITAVDVAINLISGIPVPSAAWQRGQVLNAYVTCIAEAQNIKTVSSEDKFKTLTLASAGPTTSKTKDCAAPLYSKREAACEFFFPNRLNGSNGKTILSFLQSRIESFEKHMQDRHFTDSDLDTLSRNRLGQSFFKQYQLKKCFDSTNLTDCLAQAELQNSKIKSLFEGRLAEEALFEIRKIPELSDFSSYYYQHLKTSKIAEKKQDGIKTGKALDMSCFGAAAVPATAPAQQ